MRKVSIAIVLLFSLMVGCERFSNSYNDIGIQCGSDFSHAESAIKLDMENPTTFAAIHIGKEESIKADINSYGCISTRPDYDVVIYQKAERQFALRISQIPHDKKIFHVTDIPHINSAFDIWLECGEFDTAKTLIDNTYSVFKTNVQVSAAILRIERDEKELPISERQCVATPKNPGSGAILLKAVNGKGAAIPANVLSLKRDLDSVVLESIEDEAVFDMCGVTKIPEFKRLIALQSRRYSNLNLLGEFEQTPLGCYFLPSGQTWFRAYTEAGGKVSVFEDNIKHEGAMHLVDIRLEPLKRSFTDWSQCPGTNSEQAIFVKRKIEGRPINIYSYDSSLKSTKLVDDEECSPIDSFAEQIFAADLSEKSLP
jgi:hypothetical protein